MLKHLRDEFPELLQAMRDSGELKDDVATKLLEVETNFKAQYVKRLAEERQKP